MSESDPTAAELLTAVNAAILNLIANKFKSQTIGGRSYTRFELDELREMRKQLQMEVREPGSVVRLGDISGTY
jgi:hypothetical protein